MTQNLDLLTIRLTELQQDVGQVRDVVRQAKTRRDRFARLSRVKSEIEGPLNDAFQGTGQLVGATYRHPDLADLLERYDVSATSLENAVRAVSKKMVEIEEILKDLQSGFIDLGEVDLGLINTLCRTVDRKIDEILESRRTGPADVSAAWDQFDRLLGNECRILFAEYVDLLGGLTLRDSGLDNRVSELTEELLRELQTPLLRAVPARPAELSGTTDGAGVNSLVKLWFPEWTIWDVPMFGHDAGLAWTRTGGQLVAQLLGDSPSVARRCLVADAFAACTVGPAYACAAILLRLGSLPDSGSPPNVDRAHLIIQVLRAMGRAGGFGAAVQTVADCWGTAMEQRGRTAEPSDRDGLDRLADDALDAISTVLPFGPALWDEAIEELGPLLEGEGSGNRRSKSQGAARVRGLLNAAWSVRLVKPDQADTIGRTAMQLWTPPRRSSERERTGGPQTQSPMPWKEHRHGHS